MMGQCGHNHVPELIGPERKTFLNQIKMANRVLVWFSCGAASAVAAKLAVDKYGDRCEVLYCDTLAFEHPDNMRFFKDVEKWIGKEIKILKSEKYKDIYDVFEKTRYLDGVHGARCTTELKKNVRLAYERPGDIQIFGLTYDEQGRMRMFEERNQDIDLEWILDDHKINKSNCYAWIREAGIELPEMYKLGYNNNNCIGCVKGQSGYWNKIRVDFPEAFERMAKMERKLDVAINKSYAKKIKLACGSIINNPNEARFRIFLDELHPEAGRDVPMPDIECGVLCVNPGTEEQSELF